MHHKKTEPYGAMKAPNVSSNLSYLNPPPLLRRNGLLHLPHNPSPDSLDSYPGLPSKYQGPSGEHVRAVRATYGHTSGPSGPHVQSGRPVRAIRAVRANMSGPSGPHVWAVRATGPQGHMSGPCGPHVRAVRAVQATCPGRPGHMSVATCPGRPGHMSALVRAVRATCPGCPGQSSGCPGWGPK